MDRSAPTIPCSESLSPAFSATAGQQNCDAGMELADEQREWVRHCETLHAFADKDGIVCIPAGTG